MAKKSNKEKREIAERLYINDGLTYDQINKQLEVSTSSLSKWAKEDNWKKRKETLSTAPHKMKELILEEAQKVIAGEQSTVNADSLIKLMNVYDKLDKNVISPQVFLSVFQELDSFAIKEDPYLAEQIRVIQNAFLLNMIEKNG